MFPKKICLESTADGSHTLFLPEMGEHYHSVNGAIQESRHVYLEAAFNRCRKTSVHVLELGFGTGLNALLTGLESRKREIETVYTTLEKYPLPPEIVDSLNYKELDRELFAAIHRAEWEKPVALTSYFRLQKIRTDFNTYEFPDKYDVVYYDAFAPDKQPEVWSPELFDKLFRATHPGGILTTYCAKGNIRRLLQQAGFKAERIPGPPGKREMLRAGKDV